MNPRKFHLFIVICLVILIGIPACTPQPAPTPLIIEEHALTSLGDLDMGDWVPVEGNRVDILAKHAAERGVSAPGGVNTLYIGADIFRAVESYEEGSVTVNLTANDQQVYTVDAGVVSPLNNFRSLWAVDDQWVMEVAHVEENPEDPSAAFITWGEIIQDGKSLNQKHGYEEAFGFQLLNESPFFFFKKDGQIGISYDGKEIPLNFTDVPHYLCCSAGSLNPRSAPNMVSFFAKRENVDYYVEIGVFQ